jgi:hypothetical protein
LVITSGPDGNLWFVEANAGVIGRISTAGAILEFRITRGLLGTGLSAGSDGNLWFTTQLPGRIGRITPIGAIVDFSSLDSSTLLSTPSGIVDGPDGRMWYLEGRGDDQVARFSPVSLTISPGSSALVTTQHFDLTLRIFTAGLGITGGQALFDGADVTPTLAACIVPGTLTLVAGGLTFRCPNLTGGFAPGVHTFSVRVDFTDGSSARDTVMWQFDPNHEP